MNKKNKIKVLFLSAWYPNRYDAMAGLFVRKHAEAVSLYCDVTVLYVYGDKKIVDFEVVNQRVGKIEEWIVYYPYKENSWLGKISKQINYLKAYIKGIRALDIKQNKPNIIHVNILTRTGFIAYLLSKSYNIPYVITEHWSRYFRNRNSYRGVFRKLITKLVVKNASAVLPVSTGLQKAMIDHKLLNRNYQVVNNVVDDYFFEDIKLNKTSNKKRILHISCFEEPVKNICGILRAVKALSTQRTDFELVIVGTGIDYDTVVSYANELNLPKKLVEFTGELSPAEVATQFYQADFFVLFSNYENAPVVISESLSCGVPVISTNVGAISEMVDDSNGVLIEAEDEIALTNSMNYMLDNLNKFNTISIKKEAQKKYSFAHIGNIIINIYYSIIYEI
jgi:glycosyltransferase involved in cell wall biosynthesis